MGFSLFKFITGLVLIGAGIITGQWGLAAVGGSLVAGQFFGLEDRARTLISNPLSTQESGRIAYGDTRLGLQLVDRRIDTASPDDRDLYLTGMLCLGSRSGAPNSGAIEAINGIYLDNKLAVDAGGTVQPDFVFGGAFPFDTVHHIGKHLGTTTQTVDATLNSKFPSVWDANHRARGWAYLTFALRFFRQIYQLGQPPNVTVDVSGRVLWDPRLGSSGSGLNWAHSNTSALVLLDLLLDTKFGARLTEADIDSQSFQDMADHCEESVTVPDDAGGTTTQPRYTFDGVIDTSRPVDQNIAEILSSMGPAELVYQEGIYRLVIRRDVGATGFGTITLDESNILAEPNMNVRLPGIGEFYNEVTARYIDPQQDYRLGATQWPPGGETNTYLADDNDILSPAKIELPGTQNVHRARQIAKIKLLESRENITCGLTCNEEALTLQVGDVVPVTHTSLGWTTKPFWVRQIYIGLPVKEGDDLAVRLVLQEYQQSSYDVTGDVDAPLFPDTNLAEEADIGPPTGLSATSDGTTSVQRGDGSTTERIKVEWTKAASLFLKYTEVQAKLDADSEWDTYGKVPEDGDQILFIDEFAKDDVVDIQARSVSLRDFPSAWASIDDHVVGTDTSAPTTPTGFAYSLNKAGLRLTWDTSPDGDFDHFALREGASFAAGTVIDDHLDVTTIFIPLNQFDTYGLDRTNTFRLKAFDRTGNASAEATLAVNDTAPDASGLTIAVTQSASSIAVKVTGLSGSGGDRLELLADTADPPTHLLDARPYDPATTTEVRLFVIREPEIGLEPGATVKIRVRVTDDLASALGDEDETATTSVDWSDDPAAVLAAGAPTNAPTVPNTAVQWIQQADGTVMAVLTISAYSQGALQADSLRIYAREGGGTAWDKATDVALNSWFPMITGSNLPRIRNLKPGATYSFGVSAWRKHAPDGSGNTESETSIVSPATSPDWQDLVAPASNTTGQIGGQPASEVGPGGKLAYDGLETVSGVPSLKGTARIDGYLASDAKDGAKRAKNAFTAGLDTAPRLGTLKPMTALAAANRTSAPTNYTPPLLSAADVGATATITVAAFDMRVGSLGLGYGGGSVAGLSFSTQYHVYMDDPDLSGDASPTYGATTSESTILNSEDRIYVGTVTTPPNGGGPTDEDDPGGGIGGGCVAAESWIDGHRRAIEIQAGDPMDVLDGEERAVRAAWAVGGIRRRHCVRLVSRSGASLIVSYDTPITMRDGRSLEAFEVDGHSLYVEDEHGGRWEPTVAQPVGVREIIPINVGGSSFLAGETQHAARIATHNLKKIA